MFNRAFEWCRVVNPMPASGTIEARKAAARDIGTEIDSAGTWDVAFDCAAGVVAGFEAVYTQTSPIVGKLVSAIRNHDSAFPGDLSENALELRVTAALTLGELLALSEKALPIEEAVVIGAVLQSGLGIRPAPDEKYLRQMIDELRGLAERVREDGARSKRHRASTYQQSLAGMVPAEGQPTWKTITAGLNSAFANVLERSAMDREEIDVLWWIFAGASATTGELLAKMSPGASILCCGTEMGDRSLLPPGPSAEAMIRRAYEQGRKGKDLAARTIEAVAADWSPSLLTALAPNAQGRDIGKRYPALFPLSWLCDRLIESHGAPGWLSEFEIKTSISKTHTRSPEDWSGQIFRERIAIRLHGGMQ